MWLSLALDGEVSEFERRLLGSHLARCPACDEYSQMVDWSTAVLRGEALEALEAPIVLPRRRRHQLASVRFLAPVVAAAAATIIALVGVQASSQPVRLPTLSQHQSVPGNEADGLRTLRRLQMQTRGSPPVTITRPIPRD
jgi:anti-sigma factor RsiW